MKILWTNCNDKQRDKKDNILTPSPGVIILLLLSNRLLDTSVLAIWLYRASEHLSFRSIPANIKNLH